MVRGFVVLTITEMLMKNGPTVKDIEMGDPEKMPIVKPKLLSEPLG